ncbi:MAG: peptidase [Flavobacteriales bacterium]|nr:peptidase [Flavobacteriales bacterium]MAC95512.1 peptidase [Flavobacteriales bacterium]|tara:strand:- start:44657 stop:45499 length:843 start_codon:yes stop_codon:yes gene_type:complete
MSQYDQPSFDPAKLRPYIFIGIIVVILIIVLSNIFVILEPTERGVIFKKYTSGLDVDDVKQEGLSIVAPWNDVIIFDIAERQIEETMDVLSKDGLSIAIDVSLRFRPEPSKIGYLYRAFKNSYIESLIRPELRSAVRQIIGQYTPEELYATKRQEIETRIQEAIRKVLDENHVELKALLFRSIKLPAMIKTAIEQKLTAEQESEKYEFLIQKEKKEAERRRIDAEGKAAANRILSASITSNILKEKGITATESLAKSNNTKIVVIGGGDDGLPIILNSDK